MAPKAKGFSSEKIIFSFAGFIASGFANGEFLTATPADDAYKLESGADAETIIVDTANYAWTIKLALMQTSLYNKTLSNLLNISRTAGVVTSALLIRDPLGSDSFNAPISLITRAPDFGYTYGANKPRIWTFGTNYALVNFGGSPVLE